MILDRKEEGSSKHEQPISASYNIEFHEGWQRHNCKNFIMFLYILCKHPNVQEKVAKEVIQAASIRDKVPMGEYSLSLTEKSPIKCSVSLNRWRSIPLCY